MQYRKGRNRFLYHENINISTIIQINIHVNIPSYILYKPFILSYDTLNQRGPKIGSEISIELYDSLEESVFNFGNLTKFMTSNISISINTNLQINYIENDTKTEIIFNDQDIIDYIANLGDLLASEYNPSTLEELLLINDKITYINLATNLPEYSDNIYIDLVKDNRIVINSKITFEDSSLLKGNTFEINFERPIGGRELNKLLPNITNFNYKIDEKTVEQNYYKIINNIDISNNLEINNIRNILSQTHSSRFISSSYNSISQQIIHLN